MENQFWESNEEMFWLSFFVSGSISSSNFSKLSVKSDKTSPESDRASMKADVFCLTRLALWLQLLTDEINSSNFCVRLTTEFKISFRFAKAIVPKIQAPISLQVVFFIASPQMLFDVFGNLIQIISIIFVRVVFKRHTEAVL